MTAPRRTRLLWIIIGVLFVAAGLRNMFLPGFLSLSARHGSGVGDLVAGSAILIFALVGWVRQRRVQPR
jgi:hypothetical protein